jgi:REP element-mobilizing transposase RayT
VPEGIYHLTLRGNNRQTLFLDAQDYQRYLQLLEIYRQRHPFHLLAYALMPNHVHLLVQALPAGALSDAMRELGPAYTRYFNARYGCVGHLYQGRFHSSWVNEEAYVREVSRYIHLNPVRAHLADDPREYRWSSYQMYLGQSGQSSCAVETRVILCLFGTALVEQRQHYRLFVEVWARDAIQRQNGALRLQRLGLVPSRRWWGAAATVEVSDTSSV